MGVEGSEGVAVQAGGRGGGGGTCLALFLDLDPLLVVRDLEDQVLHEGFGSVGG